MTMGIHGRLKLYQICMYIYIYKYVIYVIYTYVFLLYIHTYIYVYACVKVGRILYSNACRSTKCQRGSVPLCPCVKRECEEEAEKEQQQESR